MSWAAIAVLDEAVAGPLTQEDLEHLAASWIDTFFPEQARLCRVTAEEAEALEGSATDSTQAKE